MFIHLKPLGEEVSCEPNLSILDTLQKNGIDRIESTCGGKGICGKCKVRIIAGKVSKPTGQEYQLLTNDELDNNIRLACQTYPLESVTLKIVADLIKAQYKTQLGMELGGLKVNANSKKIYLELPRPCLTDQRADVERLFYELKQKKFSAAEIAPGLLPALAKILRKSEWKITATLTGNRVVDIEKKDTTKDNYGIAFDLGTTTVAAYLLELNKGRLLGQAAISNRQGIFGEDVMTRIDRAHDGELNKLQQAAISSLNILLDRLTSETGVQRKHIYEAVIVGNTCMHHLLLGIDPYPAGVAPFTPVINNAPDVAAAFLGLEIAPEGTVHLPPVVSGFVGADTIADVLALDFDREQPPHLMIDIGTNAEMALTVAGDILACSAAAGPAFEGARINCGMRAAPGAIDRAVIQNNALQCHTIDDQPAKGIAGSGLISVAAALKREGLMNTRGALRQKAIPAGMLDKDHRGIILVPADRTESGKQLILTWKDIGEELVMARAAIQTGIEILLKEAGIDCHSLAKISIAGAFGNFLDIRDLLATGLLPDIPAEKISGVGNVAGKGAVQILMSVDERQRAKKLPERIRYLELSNYPDFNRMFSRNMKMRSTCER
ncbi:MAG: ASKHA domain-containing protein [Pseudomonadota bacterium]|nr:ASKHA domain-containing protein [Pseudomonadota bacterium]